MCLPEERKDCFHVAEEVVGVDGVVGVGV
jgi:hypothetical protein